MNKVRIEQVKPIAQKAPKPPRQRRPISSSMLKKNFSTFVGVKDLLFKPEQFKAGKKGKDSATLNLKKQNKDIQNLENQENQQQKANLTKRRILFIDQES